MKKTLVAIAALAAFSVSYAQSSVTLFGVIDTGITYGSASPGSNLWQLSSGEWSGSRIGFRGREDLGSGLAAGFWLEAGFDSDWGGGKSTSANNVDSGGDALSFNRRSTISLMDYWGEIRLGRDKNPLYDGFNDFDPFGGDTVGAAFMWQAGREMFDNKTAVKRVSNSIGYHLPKDLGGFYGRAMVALGETSDPANMNATNNTAYKGDGNFAGFYAGYDKKGPFTAGVSYGETKYSYNIAKNKGGNLTNWQIGATYDFGAVKL
jgi:predicted porin